MITYINKMAVLLFGLTHWLKKDKEVKSKIKNVLVLFHDTGIGDIICSLDLIKKLKLIYPKKDNYKIFIAVDKYIYSFLQRIHLEDEYNYIIISIGLKERESFTLFKNNYNKLNQFQWDQVVSFVRIGGYFKSLIMGLATNDYYLTEVASKKGIIDFDFFLNRTLNNLHIYYFKDNEMFFPLFEKSIFLFSGKKLALEPPQITFESDLNKFQKQKYCIISCGINIHHLYSCRSWLIENFAEVIYYIQDNLDLHIILCGDQNDIERTKKLYSFLKNTNNVINMTGKTSFEEWIELTKNAEFVFGNDSGYIHLAAALGTQAFVLMGFWNYGRFHPYQISNEKKNYKKPILIHALRPDCALCAYKRIIKNDVKAQAAKHLCDEEVKKNSVYKCIGDIGVDSAISAIKNYCYDNNLLKKHH